MQLKYYPVKIDGELDGEMAFSVKTFDEACAEVTLFNACHTVESWRETAAGIEQALIMLELETHEVP